MCGFCVFSVFGKVVMRGRWGEVGRGQRGGESGGEMGVEVGGSGRVEDAEVAVKAAPRLIGEERDELNGGHEPGIEVEERREEAAEAEA